MEGSSNDPWKAINQILEGKMPFVQMPNSMNNEGWVRNIIDDIVTRTMNTVSMGAEKVNPHKEKTGEAEAPILNRQSRQSRQPQSVPYAPSTQPFAATPKISMTDESVYVRYKLPATVDADKLRVFASSGQLRLEGIPNSRKQTITLPVPVTVQGSTARLAKDTLIVKLRKAFRSKEREIFIHFE